MKHKYFVLLAERRGNSINCKGQDKFSVPLVEISLFTPPKKSTSSSYRYDTPSRSSSLIDDSWHEPRGRETERTNRTAANVAIFPPTAMSPAPSIEFSQYQVRRSIAMQKKICASARGR